MLTVMAAQTEDTQIEDTAMDHHRPIPGPEPIPVAVRPPEGYWVRDASHAPLPRTTFTRSAMCPSLRRATASLYAEFGVPFEHLDVAAIGGWEYTRLVPLGGEEPPRLPAWLAALMMRLVPGVRARITAAVTAIRCDLAGKILGEWEAQNRPDLVQYTAALREVAPAELDDAALVQHLSDTLGLVERGLAVHFRLHGPIALALAELAFTCRALFGWDERQLFRLLVGTSEMSTAPARALAALTTTIAARPAVRRLVEDSSPLAAVLAADPTVAAEYAAYQREYGGRALSYEIADPCLDEQPALALTLIRHQLTTGFDPDAVAAANQACRAAARAEAERLLTSRKASDRERFERVLQRALLAYPVREDNEFYTVSAPFGLLRKAAREVGRRLADRGLLDDPDHVFHLEPDRLISALRDREDCRLLARTRVGERAWTLAHPGPDSYGPPPPPPPPLRTLPAEARLMWHGALWMFEQTFGAETITAARTPEAAVLTGVAASPGSYTGPARIIRCEDEFDRLQAGDVLVCPATSPVWSLLFASIGALVADGGGTLSHQAIIAREYRIPAVVGTSDATTRLIDGQLVTVDGSHGTVRVA
jgi:pyruvate,water dikinase